MHPYIKPCAICCLLIHCNNYREHTIEDIYQSQLSHHFEHYGYHHDNTYQSIAVESVRVNVPKVNVPKLFLFNSQFRNRTLRGLP